MPAAPVEHHPGEALVGRVNTDLAERRWCAYSWPAQRWGTPTGEGTRHNRVFFVDESGNVWQTLNQDQRYAGPGGGPSWDAAMPEDGWGAAWTPPPTDPAVTEYRGRDGSLWKRTN